jgi:hypothetical protein
VAKATRCPAWQARDGEADRQVCLPGARRAQKDGVLLAGDEVQRAQMRELLSRHAAQMGDVELLDRLDRGEAGGAYSGFAAV